MIFIVVGVLGFLVAGPIGAISAIGLYAIVVVLAIAFDLLVG